MRLARSLRMLFPVALIPLLVSGAAPAQTPRPAGTTSAESTAAAGAASPARVKVSANTLYYIHGDSIVAPVRFSPVEPRASVGAGDVAAMLAWGGGGKSWLTLAGVTSELQIAEPQPMFMIAASKLTALQIRLGAFQVRKDQRWTQTEEGRPGQIFRKPISLAVLEVKPNIWRLTPKEPLEPGEYCFATFLNSPLGDFTITAADSAAKH